MIVCAGDSNVSEVVDFIIVVWSDVQKVVCDVWRYGVASVYTYMAWEVMLSSLLLVSNVSVYLSVRTPCCVLVNCLLNAFVYVLIVVVLLCNVV